MKKVIPFLLFGLLLMPVGAHTQPYNAAHKIRASEFAGVTMPRFARKQNSYPSDVRALQFLLRNRGFYQGKIDGKFGVLTEKAIRKFQRAKGLKADGIVGPQTWPHLLLHLKQGDRGDAVRALQTLLKAKTDVNGATLYPNLKIDGIFGADTASKVRAFQENFGAYYQEGGLKPDGIVGAKTWGALLRAGLAD